MSKIKMPMGKIKDDTLVEIEGGRIVTWGEARKFLILSDFSGGSIKAGDQVQTVPMEVLWIDYARERCEIQAENGNIIQLQISDIMPIPKKFSKTPKM